MILFLAKKLKKYLIKACLWLKCEHVKFRAWGKLLYKIYFLYKLESDIHYHHFCKMRGKLS